MKKYDLDTNTVMSVLIPDTYTYFWNTTPDKIFRKLYDNSQKFWTEERRKKAADHGITPIQAYTLASIIEEETNSKADKPNIARRIPEPYKKRNAPAGRSNH
ncbi:MAG: endolytic transglycosylase MltG [Bacteroidota bacterium]